MSTKMASTFNNMERIPEPLSAKYKESFAYKTVKDRLPVILTKVIDLLYRERQAIVRTYGEAAREEVKTVIGRLSKLRNEMQTNKPFLALESSAEDVDLWNGYLWEHKEVPRWFETAWLYAECYMYRRIREAFELSPSLSSMDPFSHQKQQSLLGSMDTINALGEDLILALRAIEADPSQNLQTYVRKFIENSLWGNRCDLSLSAGEQVTSSRGSVEHILVDDWAEAWEVLKKGGPAQNVGIVMDNAGAELAADLCLASLLTRAGLAQTVQFHVKYHPWFVSDVMVQDFSHMLETLAESRSAILRDLSADCRSHLTSGRWSLHYHLFWTLPHDMAAMHSISPDLLAQLSKLDFLIFKGDLNYRKLVGDLKWDPTTPLRTALRGFLPCPLLTLRAIKADVIVGLSPGHADRLEIVHPDWMTTGTFAVIQFASP